METDADQVVDAKRAQQVKLCLKRCPEHLPQLLKREHGVGSESALQVLPPCNDSEYEKFEQLEKHKAFRKVNRSLKLFDTDEQLQNWNFGKYRETALLSPSDVTAELSSLATTSLTLRDFRRMEDMKRTLAESQIVGHKHFWRSEDYRPLLLGNSRDQWKCSIPAVQQCISLHKLNSFEKFPTVFEDVKELDKQNNLHIFHWNEKTVGCLAFAYRNQAILQRQILEVLFNIMEVESKKFGDKWDPIMKFKSSLWSLTQSSWSAIAKLSTKYNVSNVQAFSKLWEDYTLSYPTATVQATNLEEWFSKKVEFSDVIPTSLYKKLNGKQKTPPSPTTRTSWQGTKRNHEQGPTGGTNKKPAKKYTCDTCGGPHMTKNCKRATERRAKRDKRRNTKKNKGKNQQ